MISSALSVAIVPAIMALLLFLVFTYLYEQSRQQYFRVWQLAWAAFTVHDAMNAWAVVRPLGPWVSFASSMLLVVMALCIFVSTRMMRERFRLQWPDVALAIAGTAIAIWNELSGFVPAFARYPFLARHFRLEILLGALLLYCSFYFYRFGRRKNSLAFTLLSISLALWAIVMVVGQIENQFIVDAKYWLTQGDNALLDDADI